MSAGTTTERWFCVFLMLIGVISYSFAISSLTSMLAEEDIKETKKLEALETLHQIDVDCDLDTRLYLDIKRAIARKFKRVEYFKKSDHLMKILSRDLKKKLNRSMHGELINQQLNITQSQSEDFKKYI